MRKIKSKVSHRKVRSRSRTKPIGAVMGSVLNGENMAMHLGKFSGSRRNKFMNSISRLVNRNKFTFHWIPNNVQRGT